MNRPNSAENSEELTYSASRISKNFCFILIARFIEAIAQLVVISQVSRYLGPELYGDYGYVLAFAAISISFTYMGFERIALREIARNKSEASHYLGGALLTRWLYMAVFLPIITVIVYFMNFPANFFWGIYISLLAFNFLSDSLVLLAMFRAFEKMGYELLFSVIFHSLNVSFILLIRHYNLGFTALFLGLLLAHLGRYLLVVIIAFKKFTKPCLGINLSLIKYYIKETYIYGFIVLVIYLFINIDLLILKSLKDSFEVSMFYAPHNLMMAVHVVASSLVLSFFPALCRAAQNNLESLRYGYEKTFRLIVIVSFFLVVPLFVFSPQIIPLLFGNKFLDAINSFRILSLGMIFVMVASIFDYSLAAINKQNTLIFCPLVGLIVKIILDLLLIPGYGYLGASVSAVAGYLAVCVTGFFLASKYISSLPIHRIIIKPGLIVLLLALGLFRFNQQNMFLWSFLSLVIYIGSLFLLKFFSPDEIDFFKTLWRRVAISKNRTFTS